MTNDEMRKLAIGLHALERRVLPVLYQYATLSSIITATGLKEVEVLRALQWLEIKKLITITTEQKETITLGQNGTTYSKKGLPEKIVMLALKLRDTPIAKLTEKTSLTKEEVNIAIGVLRTKRAVLLLSEKELKAHLTKEGETLLEKGMPEEQFLTNNFPILANTLNANDKIIVEQLRKRKEILKFEAQKSKNALLTEKGKELLKYGIKDDTIIDRITPSLINSGTWKGKEFRRFDVTAPIPKLTSGKKQPYREFLDTIMTKFTNMGFQEMTGPIVETDFWDMDALYMPQFHSARDIQDAYSIKQPKSMELDDTIVKKIKETHENGGKTGSKGWQYTFDTNRTRRTLLRTQTTACSARTLASPHLKIPGKYFAITRCFRRDVIDATHLPEFNQVEGIIIEENLTLKHLFGLLRMFAKEMANTEEIRIVPGYFPFTEPSAELFAKHPKLGWIELGGAGILRPEVIFPLTGKNITVLAWGLGIDRIGMMKLNITDIRQLFSTDIEYLRNSKVNL